MQFGRDFKNAIFSRKRKQNLEYNKVTEACNNKNQLSAELDEQAVRH